MILIPSDNAFQRWHPIDWGFYPFSVPEFTESILRNHIIPTKNPLKLNDIQGLNGEQKFKALGGESITLNGKRKLTLFEPFKPKIIYVSRSQLNPPPTTSTS